MPDVNILIKGTNQSGSAFKQTEGDIDALGKKADSTSSGGLSRLAGMLGTGLKVAGIATAATLAAVGTAVAVTGTNFDNMKQQANIAFTTMLGSGEKAKGFLDELQQFAAATPFEFPELVQASQKLLAMGFAADKVKPTLTAIGDAVAGLGGGGEMIDRVTTAIGQMQAKGKAASGEMMQLTEAGIPAWQMLADKIGVTVPEAMDQVSKGAISADTAVSAILDGMEKNFGGLMEAQSHTFGGLLSTLQDTFTQVSGTVMQPFFNLMSSGLQTIVDMTSSPAFTAGVQDFANRIQDFIDWASPAFSDFFAMLTNGEGIFGAIATLVGDLLPPDLLPGWTSFATAVQDVIDVMSNWVTSTLPAVQSALAAVFDVIQGNTPVLTFFSDLWQGTWTLAQDAFKQATDYVAANLPTWTATLQGWADAAWQWMVGVTPQVVAQLTDWYSAISGWAVANLPAWIETLKGWGMAAWQWIVDAVPVVVDRLGDWYSQIFTWIGGALPGFIKMFVEWETAIFQWIDDALPKAIDSLAGFVTGLRGEGESNGGSQFASMASGWAETLWKWIQDDLIPQVGPAFTKFVSTLMHLGQDLLTSLGGLAVELGKTLWQWIVDITPTALLKLADWGGQLWDWIQSNLPAWEDKLGEWAAAAWTWIRDTAIPKALEQVASWGNQLGQWIKDNLPAWEDKLSEWAAAAWQWIRDTAVPNALEQLDKWYTELRNWLTENLPKWMNDWIKAGTDAMQWLQDGIEDGIGTLQNWLRKQGVLGGIINDMIGVTGVGGDGYTVLHKKGEEIVVGVSDGMSSRITDLQKQGWQLGEAVQTGLKDNMDMHSPSRVMAGYGGDIATGLLNGVAAFASQFAEAGQAIGNGVANGLRSSISIIQDQMKQAMKAVNDTLQGQIALITQQGAQAIQQKYLNAVKAASNININDALKAAGIDPSKVIGTGVGGALILAPQNNLPTSTNLAAGLPKMNDVVGLLDAMNNWKNSLLQTTDPLNDFLVDVKALAPKMSQGAQDAISQWLQAWKDTKNPLNDYFVQAQDAVRQIYNTLAGLQGINPLAYQGNPTGYTGETAPDPAVIRTLGDALGLTDVAASIQQASTTLLGGISLVSTDVKDTQNAIKSANGDAKKVVGDFIAGLNDFISGTLKGSGVAFDKLSTDSIAAYNKGTTAWQKWLNSDEGGFRSAINGLFYNIRDELTQLLGHTTAALSSAVPDNQASVDLFLSAAKDAISNINATTNMQTVNQLLQNLVDYRSLTNDITGKSTFANVLPDDVRLTGGNSTTNNFTIQMQGTNSAGTDVLSIVQLLNSLYGTATP